jgi:hypothetical protein
MNTEVTDSSPFYLARAEAKRQRRIERNRKLFGQKGGVLDSMTVADLLAIAKKRGLKATTKTRKAELVEMLSA